MLTEIITTVTSPAPHTASPPPQDPTRLYYEPWELKVFEKIECEWPLFFCYFILDHWFQGNQEAIKEYSERLEKVGWAGLSLGVHFSFVVNCLFLH